jgi:large repetitive protein
MKRILLFFVFLLSGFNVFAQADIVTVITDGVATYTAGQTTTYTITVTNQGPNNATNVVVSSVVPVGIDPLLVTWSGSNGSNGTGNVTDTIATMTNGQVITYQIVVPIPSSFDQTADLVYEVAVTSDTTDPNPTCDDCIDTNTPNPLANLVTTKTNNQAQYVLGTTVTYVITITNQGPSDAINVSIADNIPAGISSMSWSGPNGSSGVGGLFVNLPVMLVGETVQYFVQIQIPQSYNLASNLVNTVNVSSTTPDPVPSCPQCTDIDTPAPRFVTVNTTQYTAQQLVTQILINSDCAVVSNFSVPNNCNSGFSPLGYFKRNNSTFPFEEGLVMRTGPVANVQGHYGTPAVSGDGCGLGTDADLIALAQSIGQNASINDAANLSFDFTPLTDNFSFNFIFASQEYGGFQCTFADVFMFKLTNLSTGTWQNLAVLPNGAPISVLTIRDNAYNAGCASVNPEFFGQFNQTMPVLDTPINMRGQTVPLVAQATVLPNTPYRIKLVIGDYQDSILDSAVFIEGGSFNVGTANISGTNGFENFGELTIANGGALCPSTCGVIQAGSSPITGASYEWTLDGVVIPAESGYQLTVCEPGVYGVTVIIGGAAGCVQVDYATVEFLPAAGILEGNDIPSCDGIYNLTLNTPVILNNIAGEISYHTSLQDALDVASPISNPSTYPGVDGQTIFAAVQIDGEPCINTSSFTLILIDEDIEPQPTEIPAICDVDGDGFEVFDLTLAVDNALIGLEPSAYTVTFHNSLSDAQNGLSPIGTPSTYTGTNDEIIYIRVERNCNTAFYGTTQIVLTVLEVPVADVLPDVAVCDCYELPVLTVGNYFSASGGLGVAFSAGDLICTTTEIYIYAESQTTPNCTNESSFEISIIPTPQPDDLDDVSACDAYQLPLLTVGNYFDQPGGTGTAYFPNDVITTTTTLFVYAESGTTPNCVAETSFTITINTTPTPDTLPDVTVCDSYELPTLVVGNYFTSPNGLGTPLNAGNLITTTTVIYIYAETGTTPNCFAETSFTVTVNQTPQVSTPADVVSCGPYELPSLLVGNYYTAPSGGGMQYTAGDSITTTTTLYVYAETGTTPNCFTEHVFTVSIVSPPTIFEPADLVLCDDDNNGLATFDLTQAIAQITGGQPNLVVTFHETETDALLGVTPIANPSAYPMLTINTQIIYINVKETGAGASDCSAFTTLTLIVNPRPELNNAIPDYELCDYDNPGDGIEVFDLTTMYNQITNNQPGLTLTYAYDNGGVLTTIATPTAFANTTAGQQTIFVTAENTFGCTTTTQFEVVVNPLPTVTAPDPLFICSEGSNTETGPFDLTIRNNQITGGLTGFTVSYHLTLNDAIQEIGALPIPYTNNFNGQVVYVRVENNDTGCFTTTTLQLNVVPGPVANTPTPLTYCDPNNDNVGIFDLTSVANQVTAGAATSTISYHETFTDADLGVTPIDDPANYSTLTPTSGIQIVYIRVTSTLTGCYAVVELVLQVNPTPVLVETATPLEVCDDNADGIAVFDLTTAIPNILNGLNPALHTVSFHTSEVQAQDNTNPIANVLSFSNSTPNQQIIWVRVSINATGCFKVLPLTLIVNPKPVLPLSLPSYSLCETDPTDEREIFAIRDYVTAQLPAPGYQFAFYFSEADADNNQSPLPDNYENLTNPQTIWVVVTNETTGCSNKTVVDLRVEPRPILQLPLGGLTLCDDNGEGYGNFDLAAEVNNLLNGATGVTVTFYDTLENAELAVDAISSPYENITAYLQFIYIRAENTVTGCYSTYTLTLNVNPSPIIPVDLPNLTLCDQDGNPQSGTTAFDLTQQNAIILAAQPAGLGSYTIRYFTTEANAQNNTAAIVNTTSFINGPNPQTIWYRVSNNTSNCFSIGTFQLIVNTPLALTTPTPLAQCNPDNDNFMEFDLTTKDAEITQGLTGLYRNVLPELCSGINRNKSDNQPNGLYEPHTGTNPWCGGNKSTGM